MVSVQQGHITLHVNDINHGLCRIYKGPEQPDINQPTGWASEGKLGRWCYSPVVATRITDEYSCFLVNESHELCQSDFDLTMTSGMQPFKVLGGQLGREPVACVRRGTIHIFHVGMDRAIYHKAWDGINYHPNEGFERLEGYFLDGIAAVSCARDEVSVFAIGVKTGKLHHYRWTEEEGWKLQENIPGEWGGSLSVATLKYKCWDLFGLDLKSKIIRVSYSKDADGKPTFKHEKLEGLWKTVSTIVSAPGRIDIIALDWNCTPNHKAWEDGDEIAWEHIAGNVRERPWLCCARPGAVCLYSVSFGYLACAMVRIPGNGTWNGWHFLAGNVTGSVA